MRGFDLASRRERGSNIFPELVYIHIGSFAAVLPGSQDWWNRRPSSVNNLRPELLRSHGRGTRLHGLAGPPWCVPRRTKTKAGQGTLDGLRCSRGPLAGLPATSSILGMLLPDSEVASLYSASTSGVSKPAWPRREGVGPAGVGHARPCHARKRKDEKGGVRSSHLTGALWIALFPARTRRLTESTGAENSNPLHFPPFTAWQRRSTCTPQSPGCAWVPHAQTDRSFAENMRRWRCPQGKRKVLSATASFRSSQAAGARSASGSVVRSASSTDSTISQISLFVITAPGDKRYSTK